MSSCLLKSLCLPYLWNSGAKNVGNKLMLGWFQNFSVCLGNTLTKKLLKCIKSTMALAYLNILARALNLVFNNNWDYLFYRRTHYSMLEKLGIKNLAVCENQGNNINWEWWKKTGRGWCKKDKRLTDKQVWTKDST